MRNVTLVVLAAVWVLVAVQAGAESGQRVLPANQDPVSRVVTRGPDTTLLQSPNQSNGVFSDISCGMCGTGVQIIGENFVVSTGGAGYDLDEIFIWGGYFPGNVPTAAPFDIFITADSTGLPGSTVCSAAGVTPTADTLTGVTLFGVSEHLIQFDIAPCALADGTYWLYLFTDTGAGDDFFWEVGALDTTNGIGGSVWTGSNPPVTWNPDGGTDFAVQITGAVVPVELQSFGVN